MTTENSTGFVTVACKMPNGVELHIDEMVDGQEPVLGGGVRKIKQARALPQTFTVSGPAHPINEAPRCQIIGGYALTHNVPAEFWARWLQQNQGTPLVQNKIIFAYDTEDHARGAAKEHREIKSGLHPIQPDKDARIPRQVRAGANSGTTGIGSFSKE